ncbi:MAG: TetR/AcrR family transcriptional regulator [Anaerolineales bacterium]|nr:TetR/AcrR family transcriptional regulator [Anaerolineales bacterium]
MARHKEFDIDQVISRGIDFFALYGYDGATVRSLAEYMGISRSSFYATFGNKHEFFLLALERGYERQLEASRLDKDQFPAGDQTVHEALINWIDKVISADVSYTSMITRALIENAPHDPEIRKLANNFIRGMFDQVQRRIKKGQEQGTISCRFPASVLANLYNSTCSNIALHYAVYQDRKMVEDIAAATASVFEVNE